MHGLNICFVGPPWLTVGSQRGGIQKSLIELARVLSRDHEVHIISWRPLDGSVRSAESAIHFHHIMVPEVREYPIRDTLTPDFESLRLLIRLGFAIINTLLVYLALQRRLHFDVTYITDKYVAAPILAFSRRRNRATYVFSERNIWPWLYPSPTRGWSKIRYFVNLILGGLVCSLSDVVHTNSESLKTAMTAFGIDESKLVAIPNGVEIPQRKETEPQPLSSPIKIGFVGRLVEAKGVRLLIETITRLNAQRDDLEFEVYGDGPLRSLLLEDRASNSHYLGFRPRSEVLDAMRSFHIMLFLSPVENVPSNALLEALALGKAIIATDVGDTSSFLSDGQNGLVCQPDSISVSKAVIRLATDSGLYSTVTDGAQTLMAAHSWEEIAKKHVALYASAFTSRGELASTSLS